MAATVTPPDAAGSLRRSPTLRAFLLFMVLFGLLFSFEISVLFYRPVGVPGVARDGQPRVVGEIAGRTVVAQTFGIGAPGGCRASRSRPRPSGRGVTARWSSRCARSAARCPPARRCCGPAKTPSREVLAGVVVPVTARRGGRRYARGFAPVEDSKGKESALVIRAPGTAAGRASACGRARAGLSRRGAVHRRQGAVGRPGLPAHADRAARCSPSSSTPPRQARVAAFAVDCSARSSCSTTGRWRRSPGTCCSSRTNPATSASEAAPIGTAPAARASRSLAERPRRS